MGIITFLLGNKSLLISAILIIILAVAGIYVKSLKNDISLLQEEKANLKSSLIISQESVKNLQLAISEQNAAIDKMKSAADERDKASRTAIAKAKATSQLYKKRSDVLMNSQPASGVSKCDAANQLFNEEIQNAK